MLEKVLVLYRVPCRAAFWVELSSESVDYIDQLVLALEVVQVE
jgi:hypothetical protein